jgi:hypothetical protein
MYCNSHITEGVYVEFYLTVKDMCIMLIGVLCGPVHVCNCVRFMCLFAFTVILILLTVTTLWTCPMSFCNYF